ncbi:MAG: tetratricopeptide repeat protein [Bacteriovoracaceae bacterium]|nr:tetratricopeptide repeat protein [Bacteriovoracaceae bacterium]
MRFLLCLSLLTLFVGCASNEKDTLAKRADIHYSHGTTSMMQKDYTTALEHLLEADKLNPNNSEINNNLGMAYYFKGEQKLALARIRRSIELDEKNTDAKMNIASIYLQNNNLTDAEKLYNEVLKDLIYQHQYRTYYNLGVLEMKRENPTKAFEYFKESVKIKENYCPAYFQLGLIDYDNQKYDDAFQNFQASANGVCHVNPAPHYHLGLTMIKQQRYDTARIKLDEVVRRFRGSGYDAKAHAKIAEMDQIIEQDNIRNVEHAKNTNKIFSPDF